MGVEVAPPSQEATGGLPRRQEMKTHRLMVRPNRRVPGTCSAYLGGHLLLEKTRTPLLSGARKLLKLGLASRDDLVEMWWEGGASWALRSRVGRAAELTVREGSRGGTKFGLWNSWPH